MEKTANFEKSISEMMKDFKVRINKATGKGTIRAFIALAHTNRGNAYYEPCFKADIPELKDVSVIAEVKGKVEKLTGNIVRLISMNIIKIHYYNGLVPIYFHNGIYTEAYRPYAKGTTFIFNEPLQFYLYHKKMNNIVQHAEYDLPYVRFQNPALSTLFKTLFCNLEDAEQKTFGRHLQPEFTVDESTVASDFETKDIILYKNCMISCGTYSKSAYIAFKLCSDSHTFTCSNDTVFADKVMPIGYLIHFDWLRMLLGKDIESTFTYQGYTKKSDQISNPAMNVPMLFKYGNHFITKNHIDTRKYNHLLEMKA